MKKTSFLAAFCLICVSFISAQPQFSFYTKVFLEALKPKRDGKEIRDVKYYTIVDPSLKKGFKDFYQKVSQGKNPLFLPISNWLFFRCKSFTLTVGALVPVGSGVREVSLVGSDRWRSYKPDEGGLRRLSVAGSHGAQEAFIRLTSQSASGTVSAEFLRAGASAIPSWLGLQIVSRVAGEQSLPASSAEVLVTCSP